MQQFGMPASRGVIVARLTVLAALVALCALAIPSAFGAWAHSESKSAVGRGPERHSSSAPPSSRGTVDSSLPSSPQSGDYVFVDEVGAISTFHVSTMGVDWARPVGMLMWFAGDRSTRQEVRIGDSEELSALAEVAAQANMVFVVPDPPDDDTLFGWTWWEDLEGNGQWARALGQDLISQWGIDATQLWFAGYSGGADFITGAILASDQDWIGGGGAVMIGGGEFFGFDTEPDPQLTDLHLRWIVGSDDGELDSLEWSPMNVSTRAWEELRQWGFGDATHTIVPGVDHFAYDTAMLVRQSLVEDGIIATDTE